VLPALVAVPTAAVVGVALSCALVPLPRSTKGRREPLCAAVVARTSVDCASVAALTTYPRCATARPHSTNVAISAEDDGSAVVLLRSGSLGAQQLLELPRATVRVAPAGCQRVVLRGAARRLPEKDDGGRLAFRIEPEAVRLGERGEIDVEAAAYAGVGPDLLRRDAPAVLRHLRERHAKELAACLRAQGHDAQFVEATWLDQHGLTVLAVGADGVGRVHLAFPATVSRLADLPPDLSVVLRCRCRCGAAPRPPADPQRSAEMHGDE
jgi:hypothetical protein